MTNIACGDHILINDVLPRDRIGGHYKTAAMMVAPMGKIKRSYIYFID